MERLIRVIAPSSRAGFLYAFATVLLLSALLHSLAIWVLRPAFQMQVDMHHSNAGSHGNSISQQLMHFFAVSFSVAPIAYVGLRVMRHQRALQTKFANLAATDLLTGLSNRRDFLEKTSALSTEEQGGALLLIDADHFKRINDSFGHDAGDSCLKAIADRMQQLVRKGDLVARFGGEEFAVFLPRATQEMARAVGERICEGVRIDVHGSREPVLITLSVGAIAVRPTDSIEKMLTLADAALYKAKEGGRARVEFASVTGRVVH